MVGDKCPKCNVSWMGGSIIDVFIKKRDEGEEYWKDKSDADIVKFVQDSYSPPYTWRREIGIEILGWYDGVSYWMCPDCEAYFNRWTGKEVDWEEECKKHPKF